MLMEKKEELLDNLIFNSFEGQSAIDRHIKEKIMEEFYSYYEKKKLENALSEITEEGFLTNVNIINNKKKLEIKVKKNKKTENEKNDDINDDHENKIQINNENNININIIIDKGSNNDNNINNYKNLK